MRIRTEENVERGFIFDIRSDKNYGILLMCPLNFWMEPSGPNARNYGLKRQIMLKSDRIDVVALLFLLFLLIFVLRCPQKQGRKKK